MRNTIVSISALGLAVIAAGYTFVANPPDFLKQKTPASEPIRSTYSFGTKLSSGTFYADRTGLSYYDCQGMLREEESAQLRTGLTHVCTPEDGDGLTFSLTWIEDRSVLSAGMTQRDCEISRDEINKSAFDNDPSLAAPIFCNSETETEYYTSLSWRLVSDEGHVSGLGTRSDCEANLVILDESRLAGRGSGLTFRCVELP